MIGLAAYVIRRDAELQILERTVIENRGSIDYIIDILTRDLTQPKPHPVAPQRP